MPQPMQHLQMAQVGPDGNYTSQTNTSKYQFYARDPTQECIDSGPFINGAALVMSTPLSLVLA